MKIYGLVQDSIVDGPGFRFVCFVQGCPHHCPGCHNPGSHDPNGGTEMTADEVIAQMLSNLLTDGLTLSGGEPFAQAGDCLTLARVAHEKGLNVWSYSGWTFEELSHGTGEQRALLHELDVLVDGPYVQEERSLTLNWRGSRNQRVIDVRKTLEAGEIVLFCD
ncbi:MAG: anaerobic ribonucleoside-triphosphate reductase activating protein [Oscillospiraceae bacterium]|nr:anaerobic ribonucleoside-triphosphate reductase activating protein [Oscillospiraceae bacterium]